jgi:TolB-like protein
MQPKETEREWRKVERGETVERHIMRARARVAVFAFDDPDRTGLGDYVGGVFAHRILFGARVPSLGVIRYFGSLAPDGPGKPGYFEKVERMTSAQGVTLALWGTIRREASEVVVDAHLQLSPETLGRSFRQRLPLERRVGGRAESCGEVQATLAPARIALQTVRLPVADAEVLRGAAAHLDDLRAGPSRSAPVVARIPETRGYWIGDRSQDWVKVEWDAPAAGQPRNSGWFSAELACAGACRPFLEAAVFASGLLELAEDPSHEVPTPTRSLGSDALAVAEQARALQALRPDARNPNLALELASRWSGSRRLTGKDPATGIDRGSGTPPGGAAFANLVAFAGLARADAEGARAPGRFEPIAFELAGAVQDDPTNGEVLRNLAVLFRCAGDGPREAQAQKLAGERPGRGD